jgi:hypothetical protein
MLECPPPQTKHRWHPRRKTAAGDSFVRHGTAATDTLYAIARRRAERRTDGATWPVRPGQIPAMRIAAEGAVIVFSILLAFGIDAWWDSYRAKQDERALLVQVQNTLTEDLASIRNEADTIASVRNRLVALIAQYESGVQMDSEDRAYRQAFTGFDRFVVIKARYGPYETLKARGLELITDQSLRVQLTSLYEDVLPRLVSNGEIDQALSRDRLLPFMLEYLRFQESGHWVARSRVGEATDLALTLTRYRLLTIDLHFGPNFDETIALMLETLSAIEDELDGE